MSPDRLVARKAGRRIAVVLPALDEERTIGPLVAGLVRFTEGPHPLVDELVVLDSGSTDRTAERAAAAGARVLDRADAVPGAPVLPGKGEAMWRAVVALGTSDLVCFLDADLVDPHPDVVPRLLAPLLLRPGTALVKGYHRRPLDGSAGHEGGRVTELMARPLLAALRPELRHVRQPLGGEYAATRELLDLLPFATGYGVDIGLLLDTAALRGTGAIAQADLGVRRHRNRPVHELARTSREVLATALDRCGVPDSGAGIIGFRPGSGTGGPGADPDGERPGDDPGWRSDVHPLLQVDRPAPGPVRSGGPAGPIPPGARASGVTALVAGS
ncbi:glucosyl-3-phosphoglycerate synthase [Pseudonocardia sp. HH130630-07]|uniref:glucosyl-3-phosphoglycerate synthase n=1 Tax=Pseudonocardia sp. HH130630-07 TaxID=1690815 RepID=UPI000A95DF38|nr:glucosyl-3-phosphoglycerate synthase [Pseudonocardia sp. HH130630-07]